MKYITLEELERRKDILQDKLKKAQEENKKNELTENFDVNIAQSHLFEVEYLIDYIKMKFDDKKVEGQKIKVCVKCKHFIKCRKYAKDKCILMFGDYCARFEEGNIEENRKWFDKHLEESYNISKERR